MGESKKQPGSRQAKIRIQRFNPDVDRKPRFETFHLAVTPDTTILDALEQIKSEQDGSLTFRRSCRHAICGSCALNVNGHNMLACSRPVADRDVWQQLEGQVQDQPGLAHSNGSLPGTITIRPLSYLPVIKDLVVDRTTFWEQYLKVKPWLLPPETLPEKEFRVSPDEVAALRDAEKCIMCGACYASCQVVALNKQYVGPHALLKAFLRVLDPRDSMPAERLESIGGDHGVFRCHTIFNCIDACPKKLNPTQAIESLRKLVQKRRSFADDRAQRQQKLLQESR